MRYKYRTLVVGGTFDVLHEGHKALLRFAFSLSKIVYITIMSDTYTALHKPGVASFTKRLQAVQEFVKSEGVSSRARLVPIDDVYGITPDQAQSLEAILVTEDTRAGAEKVNEKRIAQNLSPLAIVVMPLVPAETGIKISSSSIRNGMLDEKGVLRVKNEILKSPLYMPDKLREKLQQPFGKVVGREEFQKEITSKKIITVGDVTTRLLREGGYVQQLAIIDFVVERKKQENSLVALGLSGEEIVYTASNPASTLTPSLWQALEKAFLAMQKGKRVVIIVDGEEDLAVLPVLLLAPVGYVVCYGQPHMGTVIVPITQQTKQEALDLLASFSHKHY